MHYDKAAFPTKDCWHVTIFLIVSHIQWRNFTGFVRVYTALNQSTIQVKWSPKSIVFGRCCSFSVLVYGRNKTRMSVFVSFRYRNMILIKLISWLLCRHLRHNINPLGKIGYAFKWICSSLASFGFRFCSSHATVKCILYIYMIEFVKYLILH